MKLWKKIVTAIATAIANTGKENESETNVKE